VENLRNQPPRQVYSLTRAGRKSLAEEAANWERLSAAISTVIRAV
jgi:DNA-binding PadR family transcriptional regulator